MGAFRELLDACDLAGHLASELGIGLLDAEDERLDGRTVRIHGRQVVNFTSCSYLGLELDARLIEAAVDAVRRFGTQLSVSRAFLSAPPYAALEERLCELTGGRVLVTPNTTLASACALPSLIGERDAVLLDHQVHMTVQQVMPLLQRMGVAVEYVRHGRLDRLDERVAALADRHERVWFLIDGVYSMHGDLAPMDALVLLLGRHEQLHLYVDDAHGTGWTGLHGRGHALEHLRERERAVVALSLNKSFAAAGGALVLPDEATRRWVRHTAPSMSFTGPLQPPLLAAALASAAIHLSPEIERLQAELRMRIERANRGAERLGLPLLHREAIVPIRFIGLGPRAASTALAARLLERGLLASCAVFPAVPAHQTGIRFTVTRHHRVEDIDRLLEEIADFLPAALRQGGVQRSAVERAFGREPAAPRRSAPPALRLEHAGSIADLDACEWDALLGARGSFDAEGLRYFEDAFGSRQKPEHRWRFHYYVVRDPAGAPLLATFLTEAWMKDDMFADAAVSKEVERRRSSNPGFLTSRVVAMGCPLTEGDHLYLDRSADWREALGLLAAHASQIAETSGARLVALRDLAADDAELAACLEGLGFTSVPAPRSLVLDVDWTSRESYRARLSKRARRFHRERVEPYDDAFEVAVLRPGDPAPPPERWAEIHRLYQNVWERSFHLNTFALPEGFLPEMLEHPGFELVTLALRAERGGTEGGSPRAFFAARIGQTQYVPIVVGLDYRSVRAHGVYRQCLAWMIRRAEQLGRRRLLLGLGAEVEKRRFGARPLARSVWIQVRDPLHAQVLALLAGDVRGREGKG